MKYSVLIFGLALLSLSSKCNKDDRCEPDSQDYFTVYNASQRRISFEIYWNFPDTTIGEYNPVSWGGIAPGQSRTRGAGRNSCWAAVLADLPDQQEWLYIFDQDSLEQIPWKTVQTTNRGLLERRALTLDYLKQVNFKISYP